MTDHFKTFADELRDGSLMVRNSMRRVFGRVPHFTDEEIEHIRAEIVHYGEPRACDWCGEMTYSRLCGTCILDRANGADGPEEVRL